MKTLVFALPAAMAGLAGALLAVTNVVEVILDIQRHGVAVLLVEQRLTIAIEISSRILVMGHGRIVHEGPPTELRGNEEIRRRWLAVSGAD